MNAYDFDNTLYEGESIVDFFFFCIKHNPSLIIHVPKVIFRLNQYKKNKLSIDNLIKTSEKIIATFFKKSKLSPSELITLFWQENIHKLKPKFIDKLHSKDIIITGSPDFLIMPIKDKIKVDHIICSTFDLRTKKITFICLGDNKVDKFKELFPKQTINEFYTDSMMDKPMMKLSKKAFLVKGDNITEINLKDLK